MRESPCLKPYVNFISGNKHYFKGVKDKIDSECKNCCKSDDHKHQKLFSFSALVFVFRVTFCFFKSPDESERVNYLCSGSDFVLIKLSEVKQFQYMRFLNKKRLTFQDHQLLPQTSQEPRLLHLSLRSFVLHSALFLLRHRLRCRQGR